MSAASSSSARGTTAIAPLTEKEARLSLERLCEIDRDTLGERWTAAHWLQDLPDKWELSRVAMMHRVVQGFAVASRKPNAVHIHRVAVDQAARGHGVGAALLGSVAGAADAAGHELLSLKVDARNHSAIALYEILGFVTVESTGGRLLMHAVPHIVVAAAAERAARGTH